MSSYVIYLPHPVQFGIWPIVAQVYVNKILWRVQFHLRCLGWIRRTYNASGVHPTILRIILLLEARTRE